MRNTNTATSKDPVLLAIKLPDRSFTRCNYPSWLHVFAALYKYLLCLRTKVQTNWFFHWEYFWYFHKLIVNTLVDQRYYLFLHYSVFFFSKLSKCYVRNQPKNVKLSFLDLIKVESIVSCSQINIEVFCIWLN